jgi:hypothetical protein
MTPAIVNIIEFSRDLWTVCDPGSNPLKIKKATNKSHLIDLHCPKSLDFLVDEYPFKLATEFLVITFTKFFCDFYK